jgi:hypothetical protein
MKWIFFAPWENNNTFVIVCNKGPIANAIFFGLVLANF